MAYRKQSSTITKKQKPGVEETKMKAIIGNENGEWELRASQKNTDGSYKVGDKDYLPQPKKHVATLKLKTLFGYKRYPFFIAHTENSIPLNIQDRENIPLQDTSEMLRSFRRAHIVEGLGRAARELPGNNKETMMKMLLYAGIGAVGLILYYTGALTQFFNWFQGV